MGSPVGGAAVPTNPDGSSQQLRGYESIEFTLADGSTDYDLDAQQATYKTVITPESHYVEVYSTQNITIKFNETTNHAISIDANSRRVFDRQLFTNMYLTNGSGNGATVRLFIK